MLTPIRPRDLLTALLTASLSLVPACDRRPGEAEAEAPPGQVAAGSGETEASEGEAVARSQDESAASPDAGAAAEEAPVITLPTGPPRPWDQEPGSLMPEYGAQRLDGSAVTLAELGDGPLLLNFWATWCVPCRAEFPVLSELQSRLGPSGLRVVGVSLDGLAGAEVQEFAEREGLHYTVLQDPEVAAETLFGVPPVPRNFVFDRGGRLVYAQTGGSENSIAALVAAAEAVMAAPDATTDDRRGP